jgi:fibronectin-binding autotransporter adhesin
LAIGSSAALGSGAVSLNGGTLQTDAGMTIDNSVILGATGGVFNTNSFNSNLFGTLTATSGPTTLAIDGGGTLTNDAGSISSNITFNITGNSSLYIETPNSNDIVFTGNTTRGQLLFGLNNHTDELGNVSIADTTLTTNQLIDGGGALTSINGNLSNADPNATLTLQDGNYDLHGNNTGFSAGTLVISGNSVASFYNTVGGIGSNATLQLNNGGIQDAAGSSMTFTNPITLAGNGSDTINAGGENVSLTNTISGSTLLLIESSVNGGSVTLSGANTFTGGMTVETGTTLAASADDNLGAPSSPVYLFDGTLAINGTFSTARPMSTINGTISVATGDTLTANGTITGAVLAGPIQLANGPILASPPTCGSLTVAGGGTLVLNADNTILGGTTIDAGSTVVAGNDGALGGNSIINSGTLATSNYMFDGPTPIVINASSLTLNSSSNLDLAIFGTPASGNYDYVSLGSGPATINGKLNIRFINYNPSNGQIYSVIKTTGSTTGSFSQITSNESHVSFAQAALAGTGYQIILSSTSVPQLFSLTGLNQNQSRIAAYFNNASAQGKIPQSMINPLTTMSFLSGSQLAGYLDALSPAVYSQITSPAIQNIIFENLAIDSRVYDAFHGGGWDTSGLALLKTSQTDPFALNLQSAMQEADHQAMLGQCMSELDAAGIPPQGASMSTRWSGFLTGQIALDSAPQGGYPTQHFTTGSVMAGLDYRLTRNLLVGALFNYAYTGGTLDNLGSREAANSYAPGIFAGYKLGGLQIDGLGQYTYNDYKINRNIVLP